MRTPSTDAWWTRPPDPPVVLRHSTEADTRDREGKDEGEETRQDDDGTSESSALTVVLIRPPGRRDTPVRPGRPEPSVRPGRRHLILALRVAAAVVLLAGAVTVIVVRRADPPVSPPVVAGAVLVDLGSVTATASSTQVREGETTYTAANTLDGDPSTAWNSLGRRDGPGPGISLTYTFAEPIDLSDITVLNGYQKVLRRSGRLPVDLYPRNGRVRRFRVVTDAGRRTWDLRDGRAAQTFSGAPGRTRSVRLEIVAVYPSPTYPDVALSEISFTARR